MNENTEWENQLVEIYGSREGKNLLKIAKEHAEKYHPSLPEQFKFLQKLINRLLENYPIQYLINESWFFEYSFFVDERVLIPRPETEELVEMAIDLIPPHANILDIGTGSGCIAITLAKKTDATITAIDVSRDALDVAKINAKNLKADIKFQQLNILENDEQNLLPDKYDLIISNPPYIPFHEKNRVGNNVLGIEPDTALFVKGNDALIFYEVILRFATKKLKKNGMVLFECNEYNAHEVLQLKNTFPYFSTAFLYDDLSGKPRMVLFKN